MQVLPRLVLGFVTVAISVNGILACTSSILPCFPDKTGESPIKFTRFAGCSDFKIFLAPCTVKKSGTSITMEQALDVQSEHVKREGLRAIAENAVEYFDFDLAVFRGECEVKIGRACHISDCCDISKTGSRDACFGFPNEPGCEVKTHAKNHRTSRTGETIVAFCFGQKCKGFSLFSPGIIRDRERLCRERAPRKKRRIATGLPTLDMKNMP